VWAYVKDVLDQLLAGSTDYESLRPDLWKAAHPEAIRTYREEERRDRADRTQRRRAARRAGSQATRYLCLNAPPRPALGGLSLPFQAQLPMVVVIAHP
jgi:hypothetical protein